MAMATHFTFPFNYVVSEGSRGRGSFVRKLVRAVASGDSVAPATSEESKVKLGGSDLKVTKLGIGVWSWGDNSYWNDFQWDGQFTDVFSIVNFIHIYSILSSRFFCFSPLSCIKKQQQVLNFFSFLFYFSMMVDRKLKAAKGAFDTSLDNGIDFFDTAEVYGSKVEI